MNDGKADQSSGLELKTSGLLVDKGVRIAEKNGVDALSSR